MAALIIVGAQLGVTDPSVGIFVRMHSEAV
jgi:hypothetical protein